MLLFAALQYNQAAVLDEDGFKLLITSTDFCESNEQLLITFQLVLDPGGYVLGPTRFFILSVSGLDEAKIIVSIKQESVHSENQQSSRCINVILVLIYINSKRPDHKS